MNSTPTQVACNATPSVLVINSGSSSLKFALVTPESGAIVVSGVAERLNSPEAVVEIKTPKEGKGVSKEVVPIPHAGHAEALDEMLRHLSAYHIDAVGHRVVNGGEKFNASILLDDASEAAIAACSDIAPVHAPANALGIHVARKKFPNLPQVAVFDTAFHQSIPPHAYMYGVPHEWYEEHRVRKYGFHGTSHRFVSTQAAALIGRVPEELQLLTAHLGNGSSVCAIREGKSADTSMGFTPLEGLVMGTRCGDLDPNVLLFIQQRTGLCLSKITDILNKESGLLGISGISSDMRTLLAAETAEDALAHLAVEVFCYKLARHLLALTAALDRVDALIFTGGIGENSSPIRERTLEHLRVLGPVLDSALNATHGADAPDIHGRISAADSRLLVLVVPTNEELVIAQETAALMIS
jgi:acetate kinase